MPLADTSRVARMARGVSRAGADGASVRVTGPRAAARSSVPRAHLVVLPSRAARIRAISVATPISNPSPTPAAPGPRHGRRCRHGLGAGETRRRAAFSLTELLVVIGVVGVLAAIILAVLSSSRRAASGVACASNLRQIHAAFLRYLDNSEGRYPDTFVSGVSWEQMLRQYTGSVGGTFRCPSDPELFDAVGSSYDWRDTGRVDTTLAGHH